MSLGPKWKTGDALKPHLLLGKWSKLRQLGQRLGCGLYWKLEVRDE